MLSGLAAVAMPTRVAEALDLHARSGLGATYVGLGAYALLDGSAGARRAVAATWLGAGIARLASYPVDRPRTDAIYWLSLAAELGLGTAALVGPKAVRPAT